MESINDILESDLLQGKDTGPFLSHSSQSCLHNILYIHRERLWYPRAAHKRLRVLSVSRKQKNAEIGACS